MLAAIGSALDRLIDARRRRILLLLAERPMSQAELAGHFLFPLDLGWHLDELRALNLVARNQRAGRYHLVWPAVDDLAAFFSELAPLARA